MLPLLLTLAALPADTATVHRGDLGQLEIDAPRLEAPRIRVDGTLDEPAWATAAVLTGFTRYDPTEGVPGSQETVVRVFYSDDAIYFGVHARDTEPHRVRASLAERDQSVFADDWIRIMLDTFNDNRQAYVFYLNPLGIQQDGLWIEGGERRGSGVPIDFNPDFLWDSHGRVVPDGFVVEARIPYASLRLRDAPVQTWGINVAREIKRSGYKESWAPLTQNQASTLAQSGRLRDLRGIRPRRLVELNPVATGKRTGALAAGEFRHEAFEPDVGLNARFGVTPNLVVDATVNPDFSQLEADEGQIVVNERFDPSFPEKRPFFLEGTEVFQTPQRLVYTRSIVNPAGGAKATGKVGAFNVGYLGAMDETPLRPGEEDGTRARVHLLRLRRDVGTGSTVGALLTDRALPGGGSNQVVGLDARLLFGGRYALTSQLARSWTGGPPGAGDTGGELAYLQLERSGRGLGWEMRYNGISPRFHAASGYIPRVGDAAVFGTARYNFYGGPGALLERWGPEVRVEGFYDHAGLWRAEGPEEGEVEVQINTLWRGKNQLNVLGRYGYFDFQPEDYAGHELVLADGSRRPMPLPDPLRAMLALAIMPNLQPAPWVSLQGRVYFRELPIYLEANRGFELLAAPEVNLRPGGGVQLSLSHTHSRLWRVRDRSTFSTARISRGKLKYQLTRALSARVVAQYNLQHRAPLRDPSTGLSVARFGAVDTGRDRGDFGLDLLAAYEPSPGRVVYLGYARQMAGPDTYRYRAMEPQADGLFLKLSYLLRM